jgi:cobalt-zinc-cadmium efflux system outer membrane protein
MRRIRPARWLVALCGVAAGAALAAEPPEPAPTPPVMSREAAVRFALANNPQLTVARTQRGLARAGVVLARTYPYNPIYQGVVLGANGEDVTNHVFNEHYFTVQIELRGQWRERRAAACAALTRTEWEIAAQEVATAVGVVRAYDTVLYRQQKLQILEQTIRLNEQVVDQGKRLVDVGRLRPAEVIVARTELDAARAQRGQGRTALAIARAELRRQLGTVDDNFEIAGDLDQPLPAADMDTLIRTATELRPEIHARNAAVAEAEAQLRLQVADRFGNPALGPRYEFNESRDNFVGVVVTAPIPVFNTRRGEILQRQAGVDRARAELQQTEVQITQAVQAAVARLTEARKWADEYPAEVLPNLEKAREDMERLFAQNEQGVDVIRVIGVQRNLLRARDAYLDARWEVSLARADLAGAVGDPAFAIGTSP